MGPVTTTRPRAAERSQGRRLHPAELTSLLALAMALAALGIDLLLPAFADLRADFGLAANSTAVAGTLTTYFLGLAVGQLAYGPASDRFGRKPALYAGFAVYGLGALASLVAPTLPALLAARLLWGLGAAGSRTIVIAVIRDRFDGDRMARAMSFVMSIFILVPIVAPTLGAAAVRLGSWRWVPGLCLVAVVTVGLWMLRLPESLAPEHRLELSFGRVARAARVVVSDRRTVGYTLAMTSFYGGFTAWLGSSEIIIGETFGLAEAFPYVFGGIASVMGCAMLVNARIVERVGARRVTRIVVAAYLVNAVLLTLAALVTGGRPPLPLFLAGVAGVLGAHALLIPNLNSLAMDPMAAIAGTASAVIGAVQVGVGALLGSVIDAAFDGTVLPFALGVLGYGLLALACLRFAERGH